MKKIILQQNWAKALFGFCFLLLVNVGWGQILWNHATNSAWLTTTNWNPTTNYPGSSTVTTNTDIAQFSSVVTSSNPGMNMTTLSGNLYLGAIHWDAGWNVAKTISNSTTTAGIVSLNGVTLNSIANTILYNQSSAAQSLTTGSGVFDIRPFNATNNVIQVAAAGNVTIASRLVGSNPIQVILTSTGGFVLGSSVQNTYAGEMTISSVTAGSRLTINNNVTAFPNDAAFKLNLNTGTTLFFNNTNGTMGHSSQIITCNPNQTSTATINNNSSNTTTLASALVLSADTRLDANTSAFFTYTGSVSGSGNIIKGGSGALTFTGDGTAWTGTTLTVNAGNLRLRRSGGVFPATTNVVVASGATFTINGVTPTFGTQTINNLDLSGGGNLTVDNGCTLTITGTFTPGSGTITNNGTIILQGGAPQNFPGASSTVSSMDSLTINNSNGVTLTKDLTIATRLFLQSGIFTIGSNSLTLGGGISRTTGLLSGSSTSNISVTGSGNLGSLVFDQTTDGTTNALNNLTINKTGGGSAGVGSKIIINNLLTLTAGFLQISANTLVLNGTITSTTGLLRGSSSSNLSIGGTGALGTLSFDQGTDGTTNILNSLTLNRATSGTATLGNKTVIIDNLTLTDGTLNTGDFLYLRSSATKTARVANIGATAAISGNVVAERYLPAKRAWRLLAAPITQTSPSSLNTTWQTQVDIVGPTGANLSATKPAHSFLTYNSSTDAWENITDPTLVNLTGTSLNNAFAAFIPGPNGTADNTSANVTLTSTGNILVGPKTFNYTAASGNYALVPNPFASPVDLDAVYTASTNIHRTFYTWDPRLGGVSSTGGYITIQYNVGTMTYDIIGGTTDQTQIVQSGQAFFVQANGANPSVVFNESAKSSTNINTVFGVGNGNMDRLRIGLQKPENGSLVTVNEVLLTNHNSFSKQVSFSEDAEKLWNNEENITIKRDGKFLTIERRPFVTNTNDTLFLGLSKLTPNANYTLNLHPEGFDAGLQAFLVDKLLSTETPINLQSASQDINITSATTNANDRWMVVFRGTGNLPNNKINLVATKKNNDIQLIWNIGNEAGIKEYELQRSTNGTNYVAINNQAASNKAEYNNIDTKANNGINYYRVKMTMQNEDVRYSNVVSLNLKLQSTIFSVYPNPIKGSVVQLQLSDLKEGNYTIKLVDINGKLLQSQIINHQGGTQSRSLSVGNLAVGTYNMILEGNGIRKTITVLKTNN